MRAYAAGTTVEASKTLGEVMGLLGGRGVQKIATFNEPGAFHLAFEYEGVPFRLTLPLPDPEDEKFTTYHLKSVKYLRTESSAAELYEKELNRKWRAFGMVIKANVVAIEEGILTMEAAFIGNVVLPSGKTVAETHAPSLPALAAAGQVKALSLPGGRA